jgi:ketosteroid isomerase-like protein
MKLGMAVLVAAWAFLPLAYHAKADNIAAREGIELSAQRFATAYKNRDVDAIRHELTADFGWKRPDGTKMSAAVAMRGLRRQLDRVISVDEMKLTLGQISVLGDSASATVLCDFRGRVRNASTGHKKVSSRSKYHYYWVKTSKGWRIDGIDDLNGWSETRKLARKG